MLHDAQKRLARATACPVTDDQAIRGGRAAWEREADFRDTKSLMV